MLKETLSLSFFLVALFLTAETRPRYIECGNSSECGLGNCCVLGNGRYSLPRCEPLGRVNDRCRPGNFPANATVSYPDGESVMLFEVYSTLCPCQEGMHCSDLSGVCIDQVEDLLLNTI